MTREGYGPPLPRDTMTRYHLLPFSPLYDFQACKPVTINGTAYQPGDRMDSAARDALGARRLRQMYEARIITPLPPDAVPAVLQAGEMVERAEIAPADGEMAEADAVPAGRATEIEHRGFGKWYATMNDGTVQGPMTREAAEALLIA